MWARGWEAGAWGTGGAKTPYFLGGEFGRPRLTPCRPRSSESMFGDGWAEQPSLGRKSPESRGFGGGAGRRDG